MFMSEKKVKLWLYSWNSMFVPERGRGETLTTFIEFCVCAREGGGTPAIFMELCVCAREGDRILAVYYWLDSVFMYFRLKHWAVFMYNVYRA